MPFEASWQPPRKMSKKCMESVLVLGLRGKNVRNENQGKQEKKNRVVMFITRKRGQNEKLLKNIQKVSQNAFWGFLAASQKNVQKVSGKCPVLGLRGKNVRNEN